MTILKHPKYTIIERTAAELAAVVYEAGRSSGMTSRFKTPRAYAKHYLEKYIPKAIDILLTILHDEKQPKLMRDEIYNAFLERANEPSLRLDFLHEKIPEFKLPENWIPNLKTSKDKVNGKSS